VHAILNSIPIGVQFVPLLRCLPLTANTGYGIQPGAGDMIGAFVGRECRGVGTMEEGTFSPLTVYCQKAGEPVALRYYDAAKKKIITFTTTFKPE